MLVAGAGGASAVPRVRGLCACRGWGGAAARRAWQRPAQRRARAGQTQALGLDVFSQAWGTSVNIDAQVGVNLKHPLQWHPVASTDTEPAVDRDLGVGPQSLAANLFASSIFPYAGFLYHLTRSKKAPGLTLFGFYFLLVFVAATIPAGVYGEQFHPAGRR